MKRGPILALILIVIAVVVGASQFLRAQTPLQITLAVSPLAEPWVRSQMAIFNASRPIINGTRQVEVTVNAIDDVKVWSSDGQQWANSPPTAWIPGTSVSVGYAAPLVFDTVQPSLAETVLMWGGFSDREKALMGDPALAIDWSDVKRAADAVSWTGIPGADPSWGSVILAFNRPNASMNGLSVVFSGAAAYASQANITSDTLADNGFRNWMASILASVPNYNTLGVSAAQTMAAVGTSAGEIALLPESEWINNLSGTLINPSNPIRLNYPAYPFVFDFPLVRLHGLSTDENSAVDLIGNWLLAHPPQEYGLRPAGGAVADSASLFARAQSYGVKLTLDLSQAVVPPSREDALRLLDWVGQATQ